MYAIFENGSKQYRVSEGDTVKVEKLNANVGDTVEFPVVMVADEKGIQVGAEVANTKVYRYRSGTGQGQEDYRLQVQSQEERTQEAGSQAALHRA